MFALRDAGIELAITISSRCEQSVNSIKQDLLCGVRDKFSEWEKGEPRSNSTRDHYIHLQDRPSVTALIGNQSNSERKYSASSVMNWKRNDLPTVYHVYHITNWLIKNYMRCILTCSSDIEQSTPVDLASISKFPEGYPDQQ